MIIISQNLKIKDSIIINSINNENIIEFYFDSINWKIKISSILKSIIIITDNEYYKEYFIKYQSKNFEIYKIVNINNYYDYFINNYDFNFNLIIEKIKE